jgi:hypothetical protein
MSGMATGGLALGNQISKLADRKITPYPSFLVRVATSYNRPTWSLAISALYKFNWITFSDTDELSLRSGYAQLSFVKRFEGIRHRK